ncbi:MAG: hypothetical protein OEZ11_11670 [Gammaproteobacteria bacterium]|nr:hypothetical protein [Gammaproteobacteria bacterium]
MQGRPAVASLLKTADVGGGGGATTGSEPEPDPPPMQQAVISSKNDSGIKARSLRLLIISTPSMDAFDDAAGCPAWPDGSARCRFT